MMQYLTAHFRECPWTMYTRPLCYSISSRIFTFCCYFPYIIHFCLSICKGVKIVKITGLKRPVHKIIIVKRKTSSVWSFFKPPKTQYFLLKWINLLNIFKSYKSLQQYELIVSLRISNESNISKMVFPSLLYHNNLLLPWGPWKGFAQRNASLYLHCQSIPLYTISWANTVQETSSVDKACFIIRYSFQCTHTLEIDTELKNELYF